MHEASSSAMHSMPMDGMSMDEMAMDNTATDDMAVDGMDHRAMFGGGMVGQPIETCSHCLSHSGILNAPLSSVSAPDQSNRVLGSAQLPVSRFLVRSAMTVAQSGLPGEHAPPGSSASRHILINVFLI